MTASLPKNVFPKYKVPMYERLANYAGPAPRRGIEDKYREVINVLRKYSAQAVVRVVLEDLGRESSSTREFVERKPWLQLLLAKWALQDKRVGLIFGPQYQSYTRDTHYSLVNKLWDISPLAGRGEPKPGALRRLLRRTLHNQLAFQRNVNGSFLRWPALLTRLPSGHGARQLFEKSMGMTPEIYADLTIALFAVVQKDKRVLNMGILAPLVPTYGADLERLLKLFSRNLTQLREELQADTALRVRGMAELDEFPYLQRFPLVDLVGDGQMQTWHPVVFMHGLENAVHHRLSSCGEAYTQSYSKLFEQYVTELAQRACAQGVPENEYRKISGSSGKAVEVAIPFGECNLFIEAKLSLFHDDVILTDDSNVLRNKIVRVRDAIEQGIGVSKAVHETTSPLYDLFGQASMDYLIVVTSRDLMLISGNHMQDLMPDLGLLPVDAKLAERIPLHHIFIVSIEDYEKLMATVAEGNIHLPDLLRTAAQGNLSRVDGRIELSEHIDWTSTPLPTIPLLKTARTDARNRVEMALGHPVLDALDM